MTTVYITRLTNLVKLLGLALDLYHCVTQTTPRRPQCQNSDVNEQLVTNGIESGLLYLKGVKIPDSIALHFL